MINFQSNQTGLVLAVAFMSWMMCSALGKNLISLAAHTVYFLDGTTVLYMNLWEFNAVSIYKHIILQFVCFHGMMQVKDDEKGMAMIVIMQITFCIYSAFTYPQKDVIDSLLYDHNLPCYSI